jgi:hypothetical protein
MDLKKGGNDAHRFSMIIRAPVMEGNPGNHDDPPVSRQGELISQARLLK